MFNTNFDIIENNVNINTSKIEKNLSAIADVIKNQNKTVDIPVSTYEAYKLMKDYYTKCIFPLGNKTISKGSAAYYAMYNLHITANKKVCEIYDNAIHNIKECMGIVLSESAFAEKFNTNYSFIVNAYNEIKKIVEQFVYKNNEEDANLKTSIPYDEYTDLKKYATLFKNDKDIQNFIGEQTIDNIEYIENKIVNTFKFQKNALMQYDVVLTFSNKKEVLANYNF